LEEHANHERREHSWAAACSAQEPAQVWARFQAIEDAHKKGNAIDDAAERIAAKLRSERGTGS
jgi:hypothetical protein